MARTDAITQITVGATLIDAMSAVTKVTNPGGAPTAVDTGAASSTCTKVISERFLGTRDPP
jgi:hypothetical protein